MAKGGKVASKRRGRVKPGTAGKPAEFVGGSAAPPKEFDAAAVAEDAGLWWENDGGESFIVNPAPNLWQRWPQKRVVVMLKNLPGRWISTVARGDAGERTSEVERLFLHVMTTRVVEKMLPALAGYRSGLHDLPDGRRVVVRTSPRMIEPKQGEWGIVKEFIEGRFDLSRGGSGGIDQTVFFHAWMKVGYLALLKGRPGSYKQGHMLVLAGPSDCGKSTMQDILITPMFGGRQANPMKYLLGSDNYNGDMLEAEHLAMGELPSASQKTEDRVQLGESMKSLIVNRSHRLRLMRTDPFTVMPFWRLSLSINDDPDRLRSFPLLTSDFKNKVLMLLVAKRPLPMSTKTNEEQEHFGRVIYDQLPAYAWWLINEFEIPAELLKNDNGSDATRLGFRDFQHPALSEELFDDTPPARLMRLIDAAEFGLTAGGDGLKLWELPEPWNAHSAKRAKGARGAVGVWENTALMLERLLLGEEAGMTSSVVREAKVLFARNMCDRMLGRLKEDWPERVIQHRLARERMWMIGPPLD